MSDLILSLPLCLSDKNIIAILGRMCLLRDLHFTLLYVVVSQQFDKHLYLTSCLNTHNHNTYTHLPQNMLYCAKDGIPHYLSRSPLTTTSRRRHGNHHNNRLKCIISVIILFRHHSYRQSVTLLLLVIILWTI